MSGRPYRAAQHRIGRCENVLVVEPGACPRQQGGGQIGSAVASSSSSQTASPTSPRSILPTANPHFPVVHPATLTRSRGVSTMGLAMTRPARLPSSPPLGEAVRCPLLESDLEQWIRCCTCRFPPVARDDDIAHDVAAELGSHSLWLVRRQEASALPLGKSVLPTHWATRCCVQPASAFGSGSETPTAGETG